MGWTSQIRVRKNRVGEQTQLFTDDGATRIDVRKLDDDDYLIVADDMGGIESLPDDPSDD